MEPNGRTEDSKLPFSVVIVYDDRTAASRAMNVFTSVLRQFGDEFDFRCGLWRFDVLEFPKAFKEAVLAGEEADLIIISARCDRDPPAAVGKWLEECVARKAPESAALVGLLESRQPSEREQSRMRDFLQAAASRGLMELFLREVELPAPSPGLRDGGKATAKRFHR